MSNKELRDRFDSLHPRSPSVYFIYHNANKNGNVYALQCQQMEFNIECFVETAAVNMIGKWKNKTDEHMNCIFIIPMRGIVTDCDIYIGSNRLRTVVLIEKQAITYHQSIDMEEEKKDESESKSCEQWGLMEELFANQIAGYFRMPFDNVKPQQEVTINVYYIETLRILNNAFYIKLPTSFDKTTLSPTGKWNQIVTTIKSIIYHPSHANITVVSKSHQLEMIKKDKCIEITSNALKPYSKLKDTQRVNNNDIVNYEEKAVMESYGIDFELEYYFVTDTLSASLITDTYNNNIDDDEMISHHILLSPPSNCDIFQRCLVFLVDRSTRLSLVWMDIVKSIQHSLDTLNEGDTFGIILFDNEYFGWSYTSNEQMQLRLATEDEKKSAIEWLSIYKPDPYHKNSKLEEALYESLKLCKKSRTDSWLILMSSSHYENEKEIINKMINLKSNYDSQGFIAQRIFTVSIGNGSNRYFLNYLSSISRGKCIHLTNPETLYNELICFFNQLRSPICSNLTINVQFMNKNMTFNPKEMLSPYPIKDLYFNHPILLKLSVPQQSEFKIMQVMVSGYCANINTKIEIAVINDDNNDCNFPMHLALTQSHLNYLHSIIWFLSDGVTDDSNVAFFKFKANKMSDNTGIPSPTRLLQSIQEIYTVNDDEKSEDKKNDLGLLTLPPRTGREIRRRKKMGKKTDETACIFNMRYPFGGGDGIFDGDGAVVGELGDCDCCGYTVIDEACQNCVIL